MRTILLIVALFSLAGVRAQHPISESREAARGEIRVFASAELASAAVGIDSDSRFYTRVEEWAVEGRRFSAQISVPFAWANRQVLFRLVSASAPYTLYVNDRRVGYNANGNAPAEFNLTKFVKEGVNHVEIRLDDSAAAAPIESWKNSDVAEIGAVSLHCQPTMYIRDILVACRPGAEREDPASVELGVVVKSGALNSRTSRIHYELLAPSGEVEASGVKELTLDMRREDTVRFLTRIPAHLLWSAELPTHHILRLKTQHEGRYGEYIELPIAFRSAATEQGVMLVNGRPTVLRTYEVDPAVVDGNLLARLRELGYNTLRLTPGPVSEEFLTSCDREGMYVVVTAPVDTRRSGPSRRKGENPSNDPAWTTHFVERAVDCYHTTKRHPSVIAFALARESANGIALYESYLALKRFGDSRPIIYTDGGKEWNNDPLMLVE